MAKEKAKRPGNPGNAWGQPLTHEMLKKHRERFDSDGAAADDLGFTGSKRSQYRKYFIQEKPPQKKIQVKIKGRLDGGPIPSYERGAKSTAPRVSGSNAATMDVQGWLNTELGKLKIIGLVLACKDPARLDEAASILKA